MAHGLQNFHIECNETIVSTNNLSYNEPKMTVCILWLYDRHIIRVWIYISIFCICFYTNVVVLKHLLNFILEQKWKMTSGVHFQYIQISVFLETLCVQALSVSFRHQKCSIIVPLQFLFYITAAFICGAGHHFV